MKAIIEGVVIIGQDPDKQSEASGALGARGA